MTAGHATRLELYGSLLLVVIVISLMAERMAIDRVLINTLLKDRSKPAIIHNNQHVIIESENDRIVRQIAKKRGWIEDVNGNGMGNGSSNDP